MDNPPLAQKPVSPIPVQDHHHPIFLFSTRIQNFFLSQNDMVIETQKPGLAPPFFKTFPVKTAKDPPICTSAAIVEIATKRTKTEDG